MSNAASGASGSDVAAALAALWDQHSEQIVGRIDTIEQAIVALMEDALDDELRQEAVRDAHKLAGSLGTFGYADGTLFAREIERILEGDTGPAPSESVRLSELAVGLRREIDREPSFDDGEEEDENDENPDPSAETVERPALLILSEDEEFAGRLEVDGTGAGLNPQTLAPTDVDGKVEYAAAILDLTGESPEAFEDRMSVVEGIPTVVLLDSLAMEYRLASVKADARIALRKRSGPAAIIRAAVSLCGEGPNEDATVMLVDDDESMLLMARSFLERTGMTVETLSEPTDFLGALERVEPDVLVLDVDMPGVNGLELCRIVRSDPTRAGLPILFLTGSVDPEIVRKVFDAGADDFIPKPFVGPEFLTRIQNRLERVRLLKRLAESDPLTGLHNRSSASPAVNSLIDLAERNQERLGYAVIDMDEILSVNERYGHAAGDQVLRRTARLLATEFPHDSVVARWGGATFGVAFYGSSADEFKGRLEAVLESLKDLTFEATHGESFRASFSAGIAEYPADGMSLRELFRAAQHALFDGREKGPATIWVAGAGIDSDVDTKRVEVLIVEDDEPVAELLTQALRTQGLSTHWIGDGREALDAITGRPAKVAARVIILDVGLPSLDGLSILRQLARDGLVSKTRVIMLTARTAESEILKALELGAFDHIAKPFSVPILLHRVRTALRGGGQ
jgi:diguanylate cyclase (GGDEF)-like protein